MLFTTHALRAKLVACAASMALISGLAAGPAHAGSKDKIWLQRGGAADRFLTKERTQGRPARGRGPAEARVAPPTRPLQPAAPASRGHDRKRGNVVQTVTPSIQSPHYRGDRNKPRHDRRQALRPAQPQQPLANRKTRSGPDRRFVRPAAPPMSAGGKHRNRRDPGYAPPPPKPVSGSWPRHDERQGHGGRHRRDDRHYKDKHHRHETHVTHHHVQRHYYYRTSARHYHYTYVYPRPYPYPVYYLVPYHVHTTPGYHNHGERTTYCGDGYRQGGVYRGGAYTGGASHQTSGAIIGSILGAAAGYQVGNGKGQLVAVGVGTVLGALIGSDVGRAMDQRDRAYATGSFGHAMESVPSCTTITWNNPQTGNYGSVTPTHTYEPEPGRYCREFQQQVVIGGKLQDAYGTACRQPDGSWEIVAEQP